MFASAVSRFCSREALLRFMGGLGFVAYPVLIYLGLSHYGPRVVSLGIMVLVGLRWLFRSFKNRPQLRSIWSISLLVTLVLAAASWYFREPRFVLATPALISFGLLIVFGYSLLHAPSMLERFAEMMNRSPLSKQQIAHCRRFTWVWAIFFLCNGLLAAALALWAPLTYWTAYTGGIAYLCMAGLFAVEYFIRRHRFGV